MLAVDHTYSTFKHHRSGGGEIRELCLMYFGRELLQDSEGDVFILQYFQQGAIKDPILLGTVKTCSKKKQSLP